MLQALLTEGLDLKSVLEMTISRTISCSVCPQRTEVDIEGIVPIVLDWSAFAADANLSDLFARNPNHDCGTVNCKILPDFKVVRFPRIKELLVLR
jgi:hypothetical protein